MSTEEATPAASDAPLSTELDAEEKKLVEKVIKAEQEEQQAAADASAPKPKASPGKTMTIKFKILIF